VPRLQGVSSFPSSILLGCNCREIFALGHPCPGGKSKTRVKNGDPHTTPADLFPANWQRTSKIVVAKRATNEQGPAVELSPRSSASRHLLYGLVDQIGVMDPFLPDPDAAGLDWRLWMTPAVWRNLGQEVDSWTGDGMEMILWRHGGEGEAPAAAVSYGPRFVLMCWRRCLR